jgi:putative sterol carrier protein
MCGCKTADKEEVLAAMRRMIGKMEDPKLKKHFADLSKTMVMTFRDLGLDMSIVFASGTASLIEGDTPNAEMRVTTDSKTLLSILDGSLSPMRAFMGGKIKADGPARDLMRLQHLLKS